VEIHNSDNLSQLTDEALVKLGQQGDSDAIHKLFDRYNCLLREIIKPYFILGGDNEDLIQEGSIGLYKAIKAFDIECSSPFRSFAILCIRRNIMSAITMANRNKHQLLSSAISLQLTLNPSSDQCTSYFDILPDKSIINPEEHYILQEQFSETIKELNMMLTDFEYKILVLVLEGKKHREVAFLLGVSNKAVENALNRVRKKMRFKYFDETSKYKPSSSQINNKSRKAK
jgi:RNA polymerase sporulation-specific sigma factor